MSWAASSRVDSRSGAARTVRAMHDPRSVDRDSRALPHIDPALRPRIRGRAAECERQRHREACEAHSRGDWCARLAALTGSPTRREAGPLACLRHLELRVSSIERATFRLDGSGMYPLSSPANHRFYGLETTGDSRPAAQLERRIRARDNALNMRKVGGRSRQSHLPLITSPSSSLHEAGGRRSTAHSAITRSA